MAFPSSSRALASTFIWMLGKTSSRSVSVTLAPCIPRTMPTRPQPAPTSSTRFVFHSGDSGITSRYFASAIDCTHTILTHYCQNGGRRRVKKRWSHGIPHGQGSLGLVGGDAGWAEVTLPNDHLAAEEGHVVGGVVGIVHAPSCATQEEDWGSSRPVLRWCRRQAAHPTFFYLDSELLVLTTGVV